MVYSASTVIVGAGFSGLFAADNLCDANDNNFFLVAGTKGCFGGYATRGGMKIGMPPAGRKTIEWIGSDKYLELTELFLSRYHNFLQSLAPYGPILHPLPSALTQKLYHSYYLPQQAGIEMAKGIIKKVENRILHTSLASVVRENDGYLVRLKNGSSVRARNIIVATGRQHEIPPVFSEIGQAYHEEQGILFGCRTTFDPVPPCAVNGQLDLKLRNNNQCTTYCFNFRGEIHRYHYSNYHIFSGTLDPSSGMGNAFVGKRLMVPITDIDFYCRMDYKGTVSRLVSSPLWDRQEIKDMYYFVQELQDCLALKFHRAYFPALEQFWPRPLLKMSKFESLSLKNCYFVGDASGMAFGVLQSFVSAIHATTNIKGECP